MLLCAQETTDTSVKDNTMPSYVQLWYTIGILARSILSIDNLLAPTNHDVVCEVFGPEVMPNTSKIACAGFIRIIGVHAGGGRLQYRSSKSAVSMASHNCFARHITVSLASERCHA